VTVRLEGILDNGLGGSLEVSGETRPTTPGWPEVAQADNRAVNSIIVFAFMQYLPLLGFSP
jgi:hypothetical protein